MKRNIPIVLILILLIPKATASTLHIGKADIGDAWSLPNGASFEIVDELLVRPDYVPKRHIWSHQVLVNSSNYSLVDDLYFEFDKYSIDITYDTIVVDRMLLTQRGTYPVYQYGSMNATISISNGTYTTDVWYNISYEIINQDTNSDLRNPTDAVILGQPVWNSINIFNFDPQFVIRYTVYYIPSDFYELNYLDNKINAVNITKLTYVDYINIYTPDVWFNYNYYQRVFNVKFNTTDVSYIDGEYHYPLVPIINETRIFTTSTGIPLYYEDTDGNSAWIDLSSTSNQLQPVVDSDTTTVTEINTATSFGTTTIFSTKTSTDRVTASLPQDTITVTTPSPLVWLPLMLVIIPTLILTRYKNN